MSLSERQNSTGGQRIMQLNMRHVYIWNAVGISLIVIGLIFQQNLLLGIGCLGEFAQMLPISLAALNKMFPDEQVNLREDKQ